MRSQIKEFPRKINVATHSNNNYCHTCDKRISNGLIQTLYSEPEEAHPKFFGFWDEDAPATKFHTYQI